MDAQSEARALVEEDPELERADHAAIQAHLEGLYKHRLAMFRVG